MGRCFNTTGICYPQDHYMVNIDSRIHEVERMVDRGEDYGTGMDILEVHKRGEQQLLRYLDDYHLKTGYMLSFNFNKHKNTGVRKIRLDGRTLIEAVV